MLRGFEELCKSCRGRPWWEQGNVKGGANPDWKPPKKYVPLKRKVQLQLLQSYMWTLSKNNVKLINDVYLVLTSGTSTFGPFAQW